MAMFSGKIFFTMCNNIFVGLLLPNTYSFLAWNTHLQLSHVPFSTWFPWSHFLWHYLLGMAMIVSFQLTKSLNCSIFLFYQWHLWKWCSLETINIKHGSGIAKAFGTLICVGGAFILTFYKGIPLVHFSDQQAVSPSSEGAISSSNIKERWILGSLALFAGTLLWSSWFLLQSFIGKKYPCKYSSTVTMTFFSAIQSAVLTFSIDRRLSIWIPKEKIDMLSILYAVSALNTSLIFLRSRNRYFPVTRVEFYFHRTLSLPFSFCLSVFAIQPIY